MYIRHLCGINRVSVANDAIVELMSLVLSVMPSCLPATAPRLLHLVIVLNVVVWVHAVRSGSS